MEERSTTPEDLAVTGLTSTLVSGAVDSAPKPEMAFAVSKGISTRKRTVTFPVAVTFILPTVSKGSAASSAALPSTRKFDIGIVTPPSVSLLIISASNTVTFTERPEASWLMLPHSTSSSFHSGASVFLMVLVLVFRAGLIGLPVALSTSSAVA